MKKSLQILSLTLLLSASLVAEETAADVVVEVAHVVVESTKDVVMDAAAFTKSLVEAVDSLVTKHAERFKDFSAEQLAEWKKGVVTALSEKSSELTTTQAQKEFIAEKVTIDLLTTSKATDNVVSDKEEAVSTVEVTA